MDIAIRRVELIKIDRIEQNHACLLYYRVRDEIDFVTVNPSLGFLMHF